MFGKKQTKDKQRDSRKHVLLVVRHPVGGIRTFMRYVYRNFDPKDWKFTIIAPDLAHMKVLLEDLFMHEIKWVRVADTAPPMEISRIVFARLRDGKYDLVHSHGFTSGMCAAIPAFAMRTPHLMTSHDVINENQFYGIKGRLKRSGMAWLFSLIDKVQSVSNDAQDNLISFFPGLSKKNGKCIVIPNGIETERFLNAEPGNLRKELNLDADVFLIGFFGRFMNQKGFAYLVEAIEIMAAKQNELPKKPLVVTVGEGGFLAREKRLIKSKGLESYFYHLPFNPNIAGVIKGVDVVAIPSLWEACPLLPMETLVCGTPLIASDCIGLREVINNTPAISIPKADSQSLAKALFVEIKENSKEQNRKYMEKAAEKYDISESSKLLLFVYEEMTRINGNLL